MNTTPYGWRLTAKAALRWAIKGQRAIEERILEIEKDPRHREEYLQAKEVWQALRGAEVRISYELAQHQT